MKLPTGPSLPRKSACHFAHGRRATRAESGALLVETALVVPLLAVLVFGMIDFGFLLSDTNKLASSLRAGARTAAQMDTTTTTSDWVILDSVRASGERVTGEIDRLVVYKAASADGEPPQACKDGTPIGGICNVYTAADLQKNEDALISTGHGNSWPVNTRIPATDYIGVWASVNHKFVTGAFGGSKKFQDQAVMRIQPQASGSGAQAAGFWPSPETTLAPTTTTTIWEPDPDPVDDGSGDTGSTDGSGDTGSTDSGPVDTEPELPPPPPAF